MDPLSAAHLQRARIAIDAAMPQGPRQDDLANSFARGCLALMTSNNRHNAVAALSNHDDGLVNKAAASTTADWGDDQSAYLAQAFVASFGASSLLDAIAAQAIALPGYSGAAWLATAATADIVAEGFPVPVGKLQFAGIEGDPTYATALAVMTSELARVPGVDQIFRREMEKAIVRALNTRLLMLLIDTSTPAVAGPADALGQIRAGLAAAGSSESYTIAMRAPLVAQLATTLEGANLSTLGGEMRPGIRVCAVEDDVLTTVVPTSRIAYRDFGLRVRPSGVASLDMRDTPESPAQQVSLFQTNSAAILMQRAFDLKIPADAGVVQVEVSP